MADTAAPRHGILPALLPLAVPVDSVRLNPANTRRHEKRSLDALKVSLEKHGQRKPIVVQHSGMLVRAGNGMLAAARELGWTHIAAVVVDESNVDATAYEIMDNRSAELSSWEEEALRLQLGSLKDDGYDVSSTASTLRRTRGVSTRSSTARVPPRLRRRNSGGRGRCSSRDRGGPYRSGGRMRIISFITDPDVIERILRHRGEWGLALGISGRQETVRAFN